LKSFEIGKAARSIRAYVRKILGNIPHRNHFKNFDVERCSVFFYHWLGVFPISMEIITNLKSIPNNNNKNKFDYDLAEK